VKKHSLAINTNNNIPLNQEYESEPVAGFSDIFRWLNTPKNSLGKDDSIYYTCNGRGALYQLFLNIPSEYGATVLLPAFHCPTVVEPALSAGYKVKFYDVDLEMGKAFGDFTSLVDDDVAAVLVINYFGFKFNIDKVVSSTNSRFALIEDNSHSFLDARTFRVSAARGDASIYSFWKLLPSTIGGGFTVASSFFEPVHVEIKSSVKNSLQCNKHIFGKALGRFFYSRFGQAGREKKKLLEGPVTDRNINKSYPFSKLESLFKLPWLPRKIMHYSNLESIVSIRRKNYKTYSSLLVGHQRFAALKPILEDDVCPWAYPILLEDRHNNDYVLRNKGLLFFTFGEILHPELKGGDEAFSQAVELSNNLLCLPVHQDLTDAQIKQNCQILIDYYRDS